MSDTYKEQRRVLLRLVDKLVEDDKGVQATRGYHDTQLMMLGDEHARLLNRIEALRATAETLRLLDASGITLKDPAITLSRTPPSTP